MEIAPEAAEIEIPTEATETAAQMEATARAATQMEATQLEAIAEEVGIAPEAAEIVEIAAKAT